MASSSKQGDVAGMRKPYRGEQEVFDFADLVSKEPIGQFKHWFEIACQTKGIMEANAMALATATKDGKPSVRMVLMKGFDKSGFKFYTSYESRKAKELEENGHAALLFYWSSTTDGHCDWSRQVRIEGKVERLSTEESTEYFHSRPKASQIGAHVSQQNGVLPNREALDKKYAELCKKYEDKDVDKPVSWGGYIVKPELFEFWQGQTNRLHDRLVFRLPREGEQIDPTITHRAEDGWLLERYA